MISCTPYAAAARKHLLDVAKALREAQEDEHLVQDFTMHRFMNPCGAPACALGHYAIRQDLQSEFIVRHGSVIYADHAPEIDEYLPAYIGFYDTRFKDYFGLNGPETEELFETRGCGFAKAPIEAAEYIETFVDKKWPQWRAP